MSFNFALKMRGDKIQTSFVSPIATPFRGVVKIKIPEWALAQSLESEQFHEPLSKRLSSL